jgi:hypothetical protein
VLTAPAPVAPARMYGYAPLTIAACTISLVAIWGLGRAVTSFHAAYVLPNLAATQIDAAASAYRRIDALAVDRSPIVGEYLLRLVALGRLSDPAAVLRRIPEEETFGIAAQRLAFAYGFVGQSNMHAILAQRFPGRTSPSTIFRFVQQATIVHTLAGFVAAGRKAPPGLIADTVTALRAENAAPSRATLCAAIPALFAAGRAAEAREFFVKLQANQGVGCDEAVDPVERRARQQPPCVTHERVAIATAMLGVWADGRDILKQCEDADRARLLLLRLALLVDDHAASANILDMSPPPAVKPPNETVLRAAVLVKAGRLAEARSTVAPLLADPAPFATPGAEDPLRPLFETLRKQENAGEFLADVTAAQDRMVQAATDFRVKIHRTLEHVRMLTEIGRRDDARTAGLPAIDLASRNTGLVQRTRPAHFIDGAEIAGLIGETAKAGQFLHFALIYGDNIGQRRERAEHFRRALSLSLRFVPEEMKGAIATTSVVLRGESDTEVRARLHSIISEIELEAGDPVAAIDSARDAGLPHRVIESYCRFVAKPGNGRQSREWSDALRYPYWPEPSSTFIGSRSLAFHDAFGPLTCEASWPIDRSN